MTAPERVRPLRYLRAALLLQAAGLLALIALTVPDWIDYLLHPYAPCGLCLDFRGLSFFLAATFLGPVVVLLLILSWRWRGPQLWPLALVAVVDAAAFLLTIEAIVSFLQNRADSIPPFASAPPFLLLPALATLTLGINLVRPVRWQPILALGTAGCLLVAAFMWFLAIRPVHQDIPGELSLPFSRTAVYAGRDLGCSDSVRGWIDTHDCTRATLLVYRGSGDASKDEATINQALKVQARSVPVGQLVKPLPVELGISRSNIPTADPRNGGLCLIITDRVSPPPSNVTSGLCGLDADFADIRSHWPGEDAYSIGIMYFWEQRNYASDHSVTFLNLPLFAEPGKPATVRVRADPNTTCSIIVVDPSGQSSIQGLGPKTTDAAGDVDWTWLVDPGTTSGQWPITVTCGTSTGRSYWYAQRG